MASPLLPEARGAPCRFLEEFHVSGLRSWDSAKSRDCHLGLRCKLQTEFHAEFEPGASVAEVKCVTAVDEEVHLFFASWASCR